VAAPPIYASGRAQAIVDFVLAQVGESYRMGATGPSVWDCSGLPRAAAALVGVSLPHSADAQRGYGRAVTRAELQPGDLVFWSGHVGVAIGGGMMVAAANTREGVVRQKIYGTPIAYRRIV
jgi:cell wall-associated NlpC family hydrolase